MKLLVITGQTATGKTKLAVEKAQKENGELINADATQVYKYLDIVTGKDLDDINETPIHLLSILDPKQSFSSHEWIELTVQTINEIVSRKKLPIIVGGTFFYISHLLYGIGTSGSGPDWELRKKLDKKSVGELQKTLQEIAPSVFNRLNDSDRNNPRRLIRRIEFVKSGKEPDSLSFQLTPFIKKFELEIVGLKYNDKEKQLRNIRARVEKRIMEGAIDEVKDLLSKGYEVTDPGLRANATFEIAQYLHGEISKEQLVEKWITVEMQYSKRQYTLMKKDPNIKWVNV